MPADSASSGVLPFKGYRRLFTTCGKRGLGIRKAQI